MPAPTDVRADNQRNDPAREVLKHQPLPHVTEPGGLIGVRQSSYSAWFRPGAVDAFRLP